jgi:hypothetical protein
LLKALLLPLDNFEPFGIDNSTQTRYISISQLITPEFIIFKVYHYLCSAYFNEQSGGHGREQFLERLLLIIATTMLFLFYI